jgi:serine/threonine-protein kinase
MSQGPPSQRLRPFKPVRFGRYTLLMPISTGGMGEIFLARLEGAHGFDKLCVIKKILAHLAEDPDFVERFVNEARVLGQLSHGNIAHVLDMGVHEGAPYIALEFIDGKDLRRVLSRARDRQAPVPVPFVLYTMSRVLDALAYAHRKRGEDDRELNLVHRDVSPQNLLVSYEGEVKIIDFGLAKSTLSSAKTNPSIIMGKFLYMSPEQAKHQRVDKRSDLYAVGLCLYELLSGRSPFDAVAPGELMATVGNPVIRPLREVAPACSPALSDAVMKALAVDPAQRFQSAEELRGRLAALLAELDPSAGPETTARYMREAFAIEYHAERKMLTSLREHARAMSEDADEPLEAPSNEGSRPTVQGLRLLDDDASAEPTPRRSPTRRANATSETRETLPAIPVLDPSLDPAQRETIQHDTPTEAIVTTLADLEEPAPPMEEPEAEAEAPPLPTPAPAPPPARARATRPAPPEPRRGRVVGRPSGPLERKKAERSQERPAVKREPSRPLPVAKRGPSVLIWLVLPLLAVLAVAGYIAWDLYADALKAQQLEEELGNHEQGRAEPAPDRRTREVKVKDTEEDLAELPAPPRTAVVDPKRAVRKPPTPPKAPATPGEAAFRVLQADFDQLTEDSVRKRFQLRLNKLDSEHPTRGGDPAYVNEVKKLDGEIKAELAREQQP